VVAVRALDAADRASWQRLYAGYGDFYGVPLGDAKADRVWANLMDPDYESFGLVAVDENGTPIALAHYRQFARPLGDGTGIYLDDLYTAAEARGTGAATALITALGDIARDRGAAVVRWITAADNLTAQRLYNTLAEKTAWVTYDMKVD